jgi:hypothetical protein
MRIIQAVACLLSLAILACGGKDKASESTTPASNAAPTQAPPAAPRTFATNAEYETTATEMTNKMIAIFEAGGKDCDKLAADFTAFGKEHGPTLEALRSYEEAHPEAREAFEKSMKARDAEMEKKLLPSMEACMNHEGLKKAMANAPT